MKPEGPGFFHVNTETGELTERELLGSEYGGAANRAFPPEEGIPARLSHHEVQPEQARMLLNFALQRFSITESDIEHVAPMISSIEDWSLGNVYNLVHEKIHTRDIEQQMIIPMLGLLRRKILATEATLGTD